MKSRWLRAALSGLVAALVSAACEEKPPSMPAPSPCELLSSLPAECGLESGTGCAPDSLRVDLCRPSFTNPTDVTNPLNPISLLQSVILLGNVEGEALRVEVTLLPNVKIIDFRGEQIRALESQYMAFLDGRIEEVAIDWYAQADDGSMWYLGEDVFNYADGIVADTDGTWQAGRDGVLAMIMPANPQVGQVYRPENIPGLVFEEVTVASTGLTVDGPSGSVGSAIVVDELHMDGTHEDKIFAPGYGEFSTGSPGGDLEAVALAVPTDALPGPVPGELDTLLAGAGDVFDAAESEEWDAAAAILDAMTNAWDDYQAGGVPAMLEAQMDGALDALANAVGAQDPEAARQAAIDVARSTLDFQLRHRFAAEIDLGRFDLWAAQVLVDADAGDPAAVKGDAATLEWTWDRIEHTLGAGDAGQINNLLGDLRAAADAEDLAAAAAAAEQLRDVIAEL